MAAAFPVGCERAYLAPLVTIAMVLLVHSPLGAVETIWLGQPGVPGLWDDPAQWSAFPPGPGLADAARFNNGGTALVQGDIDSFTQLYIDKGTVQLSAGNMTVSSVLKIIDGSFTLSGTGTFTNPYVEALGGTLNGQGSPTAVFHQAGGTHVAHRFYLGDQPGKYGQYEMTGGLFEVTTLCVGLEGVGYVYHSGGTIQVSGAVGRNALDAFPTSRAYYYLSGDGVLEARDFKNMTEFQQSGGTLSVESFAISGGDLYEQTAGTFDADVVKLGSGTFRSTGGSLNWHKSAVVNGVLDFAGSNQTLHLDAGFFGDFTNATINGAQNATLQAGPASLLVFAQGFDPHAFGTYDNQGLTHWAGTTLVVPVGKEIALRTDDYMPDPLEVYGTLRAHDGDKYSIQRNLTLQAGGTIDLADGGLTASSLQINGGTVNAAKLTGSSTGTGTQAGGVVAVGAVEMQSGLYSIQSGTLHAGNGLLTSGQILQNDGLATLEHLTLSANFTWTLAGGTMALNGSGKVLGKLDFAGGDGELRVADGAVLDLSQAQLLNSANASIIAGVGASILFPTGFDPLTQLASYQTGGSVAPQYAQLVVPAGVTMTSNDVYRHIDVAGAIHFIDYSSPIGGIFVHEGGQADNISKLTVINSISGIAGGLLDASTLDVGTTGPARFTQSGGLVNLRGTNSYLGKLDEDVRGTTTYTMTDGQLIRAGDLKVQGGGQFLQSGGTHDGGSLGVGDSVRSTSGLYEISGAALLTVDALTISPNGTFRQLGGTVQIGTAGIKAGGKSAQPGLLYISDGSLTTEIAYVGYYNDVGRITQDGGAVRVNKLLSIGYEYATNSLYTLNNGTLRNAGETRIGTSSNSVGRLEQHGGSWTVDSLRIWPTGTYAWHGGTFQAYAADIDGTWDFTGATRQFAPQHTVLDLRGATITGAQNTDFAPGANSVVILPTGFDLGKFHSFSSAGFVGYGNSKITVASGRTLTLAGTATIPSLRIQGALRHLTGQDVPLLNLTTKLELPTGGVVDLALQRHWDWEDGVYRVVSADGARITTNGGSITGGSLNAAFFGGSPTHSAGSVDAYWFQPVGLYKLSGTGTINADWTVMSDCSVGGGSIQQDGGTLTTDRLYVGRQAAATYTMNGGAVIANEAVIAQFSSQKTYFHMNGGTVNVLGTLTMSEDWDAEGHLNMNGGTMTAARMVVGNSYLVTNQGGGFIWGYGGTLQVTATGEALVLADNGGRAGVHVYGGNIAVPNGTLVVGKYGSAVLDVAQDIATGTTGLVETQNLAVQDRAYVNGGILRVAGTTAVGPTEGYHLNFLRGTLSLNGGVFSTGDLLVGIAAPARLEINDPATHVTVANRLVLGPRATFTAAPGSVIHMTGSTFENACTDDASLQALGQTTFIFEGGPGVIDTFEIFGHATDGPLPTGLQKLIIGGQAIGHLRFVDDFDNNPDIAGADVLFIQELVMTSGSILELDNVRLYYQSMDNQGGSVVLSGSAQMVQIPEPATFMLILAAPLLLTRRRRR